MKQREVSRPPYTVRLMYATFLVFFGVFSIYFILDVVLPPRPVENTPWEILILGLLLYWIGLTAYILSFIMALVNIERLITFKKPSIHFYASCAVCVVELLFFLYIWTH
jgi:hypothetical protein